MPTAVEICNLALTRLGEPVITSLSDGTVASDLCKTNWEIAAKEVMRLGHWKCLITRVLIPADVATPVFGYETQHSLPADYISVIDIFQNDARVDDWRIESKKILSDYTGALQLRYIKYDNNPNNWDALLQSAIAARLTALLSQYFTSSNADSDVMWAEYHKIVREARKSNAIEGRPRQLEDDTWITARIGTDSRNG